MGCLTKLGIICRYMYNTYAYDQFEKMTPMLTFSWNCPPTSIQFLAQILRHTIEKLEYYTFNQKSHVTELVKVKNLSRKHCFKCSKQEKHTFDTQKTKSEGLVSPPRSVMVAKVEKLCTSSGKAGCSKHSRCLSKCEQFSHFIRLQMEWEIYSTTYTMAFIPVTSRLNNIGNSETSL